MISSQKISNRHNLALHTHVTIINHDENYAQF